MISPERHTLGYLYLETDLPFVPTVEVSIQLEDGHPCTPIHVVYDVSSSSFFVFDAVPAMFMGNMGFRDFLDEYRDMGWRFKEDIYPDEESMRISIEPS